MSINSIADKITLLINKVVILETISGLFGTISMRIFSMRTFGVGAIRMKIIRIGVVLGLVAILSACGGAEERTLEHLEKAKAFRAKSNLEKARVEVKNALQISPAHVESRYLFAQKY